MASYRPELIAINDPAWVWRGGNGYLEENGKWTKEVSLVDDARAIDLATHYSQWCEKESVNIRNKVRTYLHYYYNQFHMNKNKAPLQDRSRG